MEQINELIVSLVGPNVKLNDIYINTEKINKSQSCLPVTIKTHTVRKRQVVSFMCLLVGSVIPVAAVTPDILTKVSDLSYS